MKDNLEEYGKLNKVEQTELKDLAIKLLAIESIFRRIKVEQEEYWRKKEDFFARLREKHSIPTDTPIAIKDDGRIVKEVK